MLGTKSRDGFNEGRGGKPYTTTDKSLSTTTENDETFFVRFMLYSSVRRQEDALQQMRKQSTERRRARRERKKEWWWWWEGASATAGGYVEKAGRERMVVGAIENEMLVGIFIIIESFVCFVLGTEYRVGQRRVLLYGKKKNA